MNRKKAIGGLSLRGCQKSIKLVHECTHFLSNRQAEDDDERAATEENVVDWEGP